MAGAKVVARGGPGAVRIPARQQPVAGAFDQARVHVVDPGHVPELHQPVRGQDHRGLPAVRPCARFGWGHSVGDDAGERSSFAIDGRGDRAAAGAAPGYGEHPWELALSKLRTGRIRYALTAGQQRGDAEDSERNTGGTEPGCRHGEPRMVTGMGVSAGRRGVAGMAHRKARRGDHGSGALQC